MFFSMDQCYGWHSSSTVTWLTCKILTASKFYSCKIEIAESESCSLSLELDANLIGSATSFTKQMDVVGLV